ncbi:hypothetical protein [Crateriforma spongiae]|uniref:hypothetical protein n=1 Tax=Crateriforma spongiae TaxID=2724528 RepID=UPI001445C045|nr:hypothetical protein [Crateriforma spongiae]
MIGPATSELEAAERSVERLRCFVSTRHPETLTNDEIRRASVVVETDIAPKLAKATKRIATALATLRSIEDTLTAELRRRADKL